MSYRIEIYEKCSNIQSLPKCEKCSNIYSPEELGVNRVETGINCNRLCFGIIRTEILCRVT